MGCGTTCIKYLLFFFNLLFALGGLAILAAGAIIQWHLHQYGEFLEGEATVPSILLIVAGSLIFIISFFGCCGAIRESHCMVLTFAILLLVIFILQVVGAVLAFVYRTDVEAGLLKSMSDLQKLYGKEGSEGQAATESWDAVQTTFKCCGVKGPLEWAGMGIIPPPQSCACSAPLLTEGCEAGFYTNGCYESFKEFVQLSEVVLGAIAIAIAAIELLGVIFALVLANAIKRQKL